MDEDGLHAAAVVAAGLADDFDDDDVLDVELDEADWCRLLLLLLLMMLVIDDDEDDDDEDDVTEDNDDWDEVTILLAPAPLPPLPFR